MTYETSPTPSYKSVYDGLYNFQSYATVHRGSIHREHPVPSMCYLQVYKKSEVDGVIIWTEISGNEGMSVTNAAPYLAEQIAAHFQLLPERTIFVEHYIPDSYKDGSGQETYDLVHLTWEGLKVTSTSWQRISQIDLQQLLQ